MDGRSRVEIHPDTLIAVADRFDNLGHLIVAASKRFDQAVAEVQFHPAPVGLGAGLGPALGPGLATDHHGRLDGGQLRSRAGGLGQRLVGAAQRWQAEADWCRTSAKQAQAADEGSSSPFGNRHGSRRSPLCGLPVHRRQPIDATLTKIIADGLGQAVDVAVTMVGRLSAGSTTGDIGGTYSPRPVLFGRRQEPNLVALALSAASDQQLLRHDEFGLIDHGLSRFTVILPGVVDLSTPGPGFDPRHRSARDLDQVAVRSAGAHGVDNNLYAKLVIEGLRRNDVPAGAEVVLIGHSFGSDTALDLAADSQFNSRYRVVQVVATGYNSEPQLHLGLDEMPVLALRNSNDLIVATMTLMPDDKTGVFGCADQTQSPDIRLVDFAGGGSGLGHDVSNYRQAFVEPDILSQPNAAAIVAVVDRLARKGFHTPTSMIAIDVSVPESAAGSS